MSRERNGAGCEVPRRVATLAVLAVMLMIFIVLSAFSFIKSCGQVTPDMSLMAPIAPVRASARSRPSMAWAATPSLVTVPISGRI